MGWASGWRSLAALAEAQGGTLTAQNRPAGTGARFVLSLDGKPAGPRQWSLIAPGATIRFR